ncbi:uncharacterized protein Anr2p [[Candida] anglica]|uniref:Uncharacterized protein Anr2p n=1 Tax=[Candida] anglica TaxID=148631 RepID=A0ABP0EB70_9ASCO
MTENTMNSGDTPLEDLGYSAPKVVAVFLVKFDTTIGYTLAWSKCNPGINLEGLEYKSLPSGLHETSSDTVLLTHSIGTKKYYGYTKFSQNDSQLATNQSVNRKDVKMFSLGILCDPSIDSTLQWKPNEFSSNGWEYMDDVSSTLESFVKQSNLDDFDILKTLFNSLQQKKPIPLKSGIENHLLHRLPCMLQTLGPLVFCLYKQALLRKRILFFNQNHSKVTNLDSGAFSYILSLLSVVPKGVESLIGGLRHNQEYILYSQPIYNVGLHDLEGELIGSTSCIGSTNDAILMYQSNIFDYAVMLPNDEIKDPFIVSSSILASNHGHTPTPLDSSLKATLKDYYKFKLVYKEFFNHNNNKNNNNNKDQVPNSDDQASIKTKSSTFSQRFGAQFLNKFDSNDSNHKDDIEEPLWWLESATSPMSWREYIWSAFSWFASAGTVSNGENNIEDNNIEYDQRNDERNDEELKTRFLELVEIVDKFHKLTKKWFYLVNEIVLEQVEENRVQLVNGENETLIEGPKLKLELTYQDIVDMELDPYSHEDIEFVKEFVLLYWGELVDSVEVGLGISGICC